MSDTEGTNMTDSSAPAQLPPLTNQGGSNTTAPCGMLSCGVDYLTLSIVDDERAHAKMEAMAEFFESTGELSSFENNYNGVDICGAYGAVMTRDTPWNPAGGDVLLRLPGRALEWIREGSLLATTGARCTDADICNFFLDHEYTSTRLDIALDNTDTRVNPDIIRDLLEKESFTCTAHSAGLTRRWKLGQKRIPGDGDTVYIGCRQSTRFMRCYDKRSEVKKRLGKDIGHCTRFEMECKGEAAIRMMEMIAINGTGCIPGVMNGWVSFKDPSDTASRVERRRNTDWWDAMVDGSQPITLGLARSISTPEKALHWIKHQVSKTLLLIQKSGLMGEIEDAMKLQEHKLKPTELRQWSDYVARLKKQAEKLSSNNDTSALKGA